MEARLAAERIAGADCAHEQSFSRWASRGRRLLSEQACLRDDQWRELPAAETMLSHQAFALVHQLAGRVNVARTE